MPTRIFNFLGLIVIAGIISTLALKPEIVGRFFKGFGGVLQTSLSGGTNPGKVGYGG